MFTQIINDVIMCTHDQPLIKVQSAGELTITTLIGL